MHFEIYGRFTLKVVREGERWVVYHVGEGKRRLAPDVIIRRAPTKPRSLATWR